MYNSKIKCKIIRKQKGTEVHNPYMGLNFHMGEKEKKDLEQISNIPK